MVSKVSPSADAAFDGLLRDGLIIAVGGFGLSGVPVDLIDVVADSGVRDLTIVSNNMGIDGVGLGKLLDNGQVTKVVCSYAGENATLARQFLDGSLEIEFVPQGTLAERMRAGGSGISAFFTPTGVGTSIAEGKQHQDFNSVTNVLEHGIVADLGLVRAHIADEEGNLLYRHTARNFNPVVAMSGRVTIAEVEKVVRIGDVDPNIIVTPGIFVQKIVRSTGQEKLIEKLTVRPRDEHAEVR